MIDWRQVDLGGAVVEGLDNRCPRGRGVLVRGQRRGRPWAARLSVGGVVTVAEPGWSGRVSSVEDDMGDLRVTGGSPPRTHPHDAPDEWPVPEGGSPFVAGWVVEGDEDPCNLALDAQGRLHAYEIAAEHPMAGPWVHAGAGPEDLVVAGREVGLHVAGPLGAEPAMSSTAGGSPGVWWYAGEQWSQVQVEEPPEAWTDAYTRWEPVLAGHRGARPVVVSHRGARLPSPQVDLDPQRPQVCVAHVDGPPYGSDDPATWPGRLALVVQAVEGVQVWLQHDHGWTMLPGPEGALRAARLGYNEKWTGWVATDAGLWFADLSAVWDALG